MIPSQKKSLFFYALIVCALSLCVGNLNAQEFSPPLTIKVDSVNQSILMDYSPDGTSLAVTTRVGTVVVRDPITGFVQKTMEPVLNTRYLRDLQYSFTGDTLIVGTDDGRLVMWEVATGKIIYEQTVADTDIWRFHLTVDGKYLAIIDFNSVIYVIDRVSGERLYTHGSQTEPAYDFKVDPSDQYLLTFDYVSGAVYPTIITTRDIVTGEPVRSDTFSFSTDRIQYSSDGKKIFASSFFVPDTVGPLTWFVVELDVVSMDSVRTYYPFDSLRWLFNVDPHPTENLLAGIGTTQLLIWSTETGEILHSIERLPPSSILFDVAFSPDGSQMAAIGWWDELRIWTLPTSSIAEDPVVDQRYLRIESIHPNPALDYVTLDVDVPYESIVAASLLNSLGEKMEQFAEKRLSEGKHKLEYALSSVTSGTYWLRVCAGDIVKIVQLQIVR